MLKRGTVQGMQVLTADGEFLGTVRDVTPDGFVIRRAAGDGPTATIPRLWVTDIDERIYLNRTGAEAAADWQAMQFRKNGKPMPEPRRNRPRGFNASWMIFLALIAIMTLIILALVM